MYSHKPIDYIQRTFSHIFLLGVPNHHSSITTAGSKQLTCRIPIEALDLEHECILLRNTVDLCPDRCIFVVFVNVGFFSIVKFNFEHFGFWLLINNLY